MKLFSLKTLLPVILLGSLLVLADRFAFAQQEETQTPSPDPIGNSFKISIDIN